MSRKIAGKRWMVSLGVATLVLLIGCARHSPEHIPVTVQADSPRYYDEVAERAESILKRLERNYGPHDPRLVAPLMTLSMAYFRLDRADESDALLERAWTLLESDPELTLEEVHFPVRYGSLVTAAREGDRLDTRTHLAQGADVNQRDARGRTALHYFAALGDEAMTRSLLRQGAVASVRDWQRQTPRDLAEEAGHAALVDILGRRASGERPDDEPVAPPAADPPGDEDFFGFPDMPGQDDAIQTPDAGHDADFFQQPDSFDDDFFY